MGKESSYFQNDTNVSFYLIFRIHNWLYYSGRSFSQMRSFFRIKPQFNMWFFNIFFLFFVFIKIFSVYIENGVENVSVVPKSSWFHAMPEDSSILFKNLKRWGNFPNILRSRRIATSTLSHVYTENSHFLNCPFFKINGKAVEVLHI